MRKKMAKLKRLAVAGAVSAAVAGIAVASGGTAQAAEPGRILVCNSPDFVITVRMADDGFAITPDPVPGPDYGCLSMALQPRTGNVPFDVFAGDRYLGSSIYNPDRGTEVYGMPGPTFIVK